MVTNVKREVFGTRPKVLKNIFDLYKINYIQNLWLVTCIKAINPDPRTRYLIFFEFNDVNTFRKFNIPRELFRDSILNRIFNLYIDEKHGTVYVASKDTYYKFDFKDFKKWILDETKCKFWEASVEGSKNSTPFSRFFRKKMGSGFSLTDIDYVLPDRQICIEEKTFTIDNSNKGYLGYGQYISLTEFRRDIVKEKVRILLVFSSKNDNRNFSNRSYIIVDFNNVYSSRDIKDKVDKRWGRVVVIDLVKYGKKINNDNELIRELLG